MHIDRQWSQKSYMLFKFNIPLFGREMGRARQKNWITHMYIKGVCTCVYSYQMSARTTVGRPDCRKNFRA